MTNRNNEDVARALEALSAGEHHEEEPQGDSIHGAPTPPPAQPAARSTAAQRPAASPRASPARPQAPRAAPATKPAAAAPTASLNPPKVTSKPASSSTARAASPGQAAPSAPRPAAPVTRPAGPVARPGAPAARPATPPAGARPAAPAAFHATPPSTESQIVDDDAVIVPAPDASVFLHKPQYAPRPKRQAFGQSIHFRQTLIPILLTAGFIMISLGALHFTWSSENNPMTDLPGWFLGVLFGFGALLWVLAVANMLSVKSALQAQARRPKATN